LSIIPIMKTMKLLELRKGISDGEMQALQGH